jgi:hypothetical protein
MPYKEITTAGEGSIKAYCAKKGMALLSGTNGKLPYSSPEIDKTWVSNAQYLGKPIEDSETYADALIAWYNAAALKYDLDANILVAQGWIESELKAWNYAPNSDASGISQFVMLTFYDIVVSNRIQNVNPLSNAERDTLIAGLTNPYSVVSYKARQNSNTAAKENRPILHQNIIDNPDLMIKAQARLMASIAIKTKNLASSTLFGYSRGPAYAHSTYTESVRRCQAAEDGGSISGGYTKEGTDYVVKVFGILGDPDNLLQDDSRNDLGKGYKPAGFTMGYHGKLYPGGNKKLFNMFDVFNTFDANVSESDDYGIKVENIEDLPPLTDQTEYPYKAIYFPEDQYKPQGTDKGQIVLHHTVSGKSVEGVVYHWRSNGDRVATSFVVSRDGDVYQLYSTGFWGIHLFLNDEPFEIMNAEYRAADNQIENIGAYRAGMEKASIGIEIDSWGGLVQKDDGSWWNYNKTVQVPDANVVLYPAGWRGYDAFEKYTDRQLEATAVILKALNTKWKIPLTYNEDMWDFSPNAMNKVNGVWTHVSFRKDKSDCHPQVQMIDMLKGLTGN